MGGSSVTWSLFFIARNFCTGSYLHVLLLGEGGDDEDADDGMDEEKRVMQLHMGNATSIRLREMQRV